MQDADQTCTTAATRRNACRNERRNLARTDHGRRLRSRTTLTERPRLRNQSPSGLLRGLPLEWNASVTRGLGRAKISAQGYPKGQAWRNKAAQATPLALLHVRVEPWRDVSA